MIVIVRLDLDLYSLDHLEQFVTSGVITISEAREAQAFRCMSEIAQLFLIRKWQIKVNAVKSA